MSQQLVVHFWFILLLEMFSPGQKLSLYGYIIDVFKKPRLQL